MNMLGPTHVLDESSRMCLLKARARANGDVLLITIRSTAFHESQAGSGSTQLLDIID
jgi:hypothetical protein